MVAACRCLTARFTCLALELQFMSTLAQSDLEELCRPLAGDGSPCAGTDPQRHHISNACRSAYPRLSAASLQTHWEGAVAYRRQALHASKSNGLAAATFREACIATEHRFKNPQRDEQIR